MEEEQQLAVIEVDPNDLVVANDGSQQNDPLLATPQNDEAENNGDEVGDNPDENIVTWTVTEKMKQKACFKGYL